MDTVLAGGAAFLLGPLIDWAVYNKKNGLTLVLWIAFGLLLGYGLVTAVRHPVKVELAPYWSLAGWLLTVAGAALSLYSVFWEVSPARHPQASATASAGPHLVMDGTYALTRHPGVLWFGLLVLGLFLVSRSRIMLVAGPVWTALDALWVLLQERFFFHRMFPEYAHYCQTTPMLLPTPASVRRFLRGAQG